MKRLNNEVTIQELDKLKILIQRARNQYQKAQQLEDQVFEYLDFIGIDEPSDISSVSAENVDNLEDAISCYLNYGEWSVDGIIEKIKEISTVVEG